MNPKDPYGVPMGVVPRLAKRGVSNLRQAAQAALEALLAADLAMANGGILACHASRKQIAAAIEALRAALSEPQPDEPVGALPPTPDLGPEWTDYWSNKVNTIMRNYAQQAVEAERERCAKVCEKQFPVGDHDWRVSRAAAEKCAAAIRGT